jgi:hypothetical protein
LLRGPLHLQYSNRCAYSTSSSWKGNFGPWSLVRQKVKLWKPHVTVPYKNNSVLASMGACLTAQMAVVRVVGILVEGHFGRLFINVKARMSASLL